MKSAKIALVAAFVMTVLNSVRCAVMLFFSAKSLSYERNLAIPKALPKTGGMKATSQEIIQAAQEQMQALHQEMMIHQYQISLYAWIAGLAWNLLLAGLLIFAIRRFQKSN